MLVKLDKKILRTDVFMCVEGGRLKPLGRSYQSIIDHLEQKGDLEAVENVLELRELSRNLSYDMLFVHLAELGIFRLPRSLANKEISDITANHIQLGASYLSREARVGT